MNVETENYLRHLRAQLSELRTARDNIDHLQEEINELENSFFVLRQERSENETHIDENIRAHTRVLDDMRAENNQTLANVRERQTQLDSINQQLQAKNSELANLSAQINSQQWKIETNERLTNSLRDQINTISAQKVQIQAESDSLFEMIAEIKEHISTTLNKIASHRNRLIQKEKNLLVLEKRREELMQTLEAQRQNLRLLNFKVERNDQELEKAKEALESKSKSIKQFKENTNQLLKENNDLDEKLNSEIKQGADFESKIGLLKEQTSRCNAKKNDTEERIKQKLVELEEITKASDEIMSKRNLAQKKSSMLKDAVEKYSRLAIKMQADTRSADYLKKAEALEDLMASFEKLVCPRY